MWILVIILLSVLLYIVVSLISAYQKKSYIPADEIYQYWINPSSTPWSNEKRMRYYNNEHRVVYNKVAHRKYHSCIETGYVRSMNRHG